MTDPLDAVESALHQAGKRLKRQHDTISAQCPAHEDKNPSLSVSRGQHQALVLHCHTGCEPADVLDALHLTWKDVSTSDGRDDVERRWPYHDEHGTLIYEVVRKPGKKFLQRRPDGAGGWIWNLRGVSRTLYRLPAVIAAARAGETIYVAEGEKDVDRLVAGGLTATCNSGGAGKFDERFADHFVGAGGVVVIADNDDAGHAHARDVEVACLRRSIPVEVVSSPKGKDYSDHVAAGGTVFDLRPLGAPEGDANDDEAPNDPDSILIDWEAFWSADRDEADWLAEPIIAAKRGTAIFAPGGTGKSLLALYISAALATGAPMFGEPAREPVRVLYLDFEMTESDLAERLESMGYGPGSDLSNLHYALLPSLPSLDTPEGGKAVVDLAEQVNADLVVIDTLGRAVEGDENEADTIRRLYRHTGLHLKHAGRAFLRVDHAGKDLTKGQRGTSAKNDDVDVVWQMIARDRGGFDLTAKKRRMSWVPEHVKITLDETSVMHFRLTDGITWLAGTAEVADQLDSLGVDPDSSIRAQQKAFRDAGGKARHAVLRDAIKYRQHRRNPVDNYAPGVGAHLGAHPDEQATGHTRGTPSDSDTNHQVDAEKSVPRAHRGTPGHGAWGTVCPPIGGTPSRTPSEQTGVDDEWMPF